MITIPFAERDDQRARYLIETVNWPEFPRQSTAALSCSWSHEGIRLDFTVHDTAIQAQIAEDNGPVWRDRCIEWFASFNGSDYYNFEVNAIGTLLVQYGADRTHRHAIPLERLALVKRWSSLGRRPFGLTGAPVSWCLSLVIPRAFFVPEGFRIEPGTVAQGNFYLCGDDLPVRQYLSYYPVQSARPDFHRPESFGPIRFR